MKKLLFYFAFLIGLPVFAQHNFSFVKNALKEQHPEIKLDDRIIIINNWSSADTESREFNKALNKTVSVYEFAKLKGGQKGVIGITIYKGEGNGSNILLTGENFNKLVKLESINIEEKNIVYNSNGEVIYKSLPANKIFDSIHKLVTR